MDLDFARYLPLAVLGAVLGLDVVSFPQAMVSRPIVASTLAGGLVGAPLRGLTMGVLLEFFALESLPFGASRYPEWGSAAVVGGSLFAAVPDGMAGAMVVAAFAALVTASLGSSSMVFLRRWNAIWARGQQRRIARGSGSAVVALQLAGLSADLIRGGVLTLGALVVFSPLHLAIVGTFTMSPVVSRAVVVSVALAVGLAAVWKVVHSTKGAPWWLAIGIVAGFVVAGTR